MDRPDRRTLALGTTLLTCAVILGWAISARGNHPLAGDTAWNRYLAEHVAGRWLDVLAATTDVSGGFIGGIVMVVVCAAALLAAGRRRDAGYLMAAGTFSVVCVQVLKHLFGRPRPDEIIVLTDFGSFPSGHVANAATLAVAAMLLVRRAAVVVAGALWVLLMAFSRTYLHAHWVSDVLGGALTGVGAALMVAAMLRPTVR
ncbi:phosphatase PAP2 family protein [Mycobacterium sp. C31M]